MTSSTMAIARQLAALGALARANLDPFERPDRMFAGFAAALPWGATTTAALALAVERDPRRAAIVDPDGAVTYRSCGGAPTASPPGCASSAPARASPSACWRATTARSPTPCSGRGKTGADIVLLNTGFAGPQLADVVAAEGVSHRRPRRLVRRAGRRRRRRATIVDGGRLAGDGDQRRPDHAGAPPGPGRSSSPAARPAARRARPEGRRPARSPGGRGAVLERIPLRPRDVQVVAAPLFHAWGMSHLMFGITRCATTVVAPRFDPEATLRSIAESAPACWWPCR